LGANWLTERIAGEKTDFPSPKDERFRAENGAEKGAARGKKKAQASFFQNRFQLGSE